MAANSSELPEPGETRAEPEPSPREPGRNLLGIVYIADDFDAPLPEEVLKEFGL
jgi:hypothetical protein